jgi:hypothetical protein
MHRALQLPEIIRIIADYVALDDDPKGEDQDAADRAWATNLTALALASRAFSEPAFDELWGHASVWDLC